MIKLAGALAVLCFIAPAPAIAQSSTCSQELLESNFNVLSDITPDEHSFFFPRKKGTFIGMEKRVPCSVADLLGLGFEFKTTQRYGPRDSTNGGYEDVMLLEKGKLAVFCYNEFGLKGKGAAAKVTFSDMVCQQVVQPKEGKSDK